MALGNEHFVAPDFFFDPGPTVGEFWLDGVETERLDASFEDWDVEADLCTKGSDVTAAVGLAALGGLVLPVSWGALFGEVIPSWFRWVVSKLRRGIDKTPASQLAAQVDERMQHRLVRIHDEGKETLPERSLRLWKTATECAKDVIRKFEVKNP